ncbi:MULTISPECIES: LacI family DNA-binding transcriptional regulator [Bifidobacterium]|uniref:LacI family DNA-binding transcriptional regulator n=1 Tax=Bifidobacterium TaxID=1678 RepID=UPI000423211F|nr:MULTISPECIES: LacI family DNA-binding transcriptional regulator [Bifidobacterium]MCT6917662.1 LacI family transcriptional regulator [Bifidobacteriales bacterium]WLT10620.1 LacI family DNA-binding transcriptional regulator [Bifidobacterium asteroides]
MREPTIYDVAKKAGVSPSTVSRALHGKDRVSADTRSKVFQASEQLGFTASKEASRLRSGKTGRIALIVGNRMSGWYSSELAEGVYSALSNEGYDLLFYRVADRKQRADFFSSMPIKRNTDAVIISSFALTENEGQSLRDVGVPIVGVNTMHLNDRYSMASIGVDEISALKNLIHRLCVMGHTRIAFIQTTPINKDFVWDADQRIEGYRQGIRAAGITHRKDYEIPVPHSSEAGSIAVSAILALDPQPTAICCISDEVAISLVHELRRYGVRVPDDISVVGFDDREMAAPLGISTIRHRPDEYGKTAGLMAVRLARGETLDQSRIVAPASLILRDTIGPARHIN